MFKISDKDLKTLNLTTRQKIEAGFKYNPDMNEYMYEVPVYYSYTKIPSIFCQIFISDDNHVNYRICDYNGNFYAAYYNRKYGENKLIPIITANVKKTLRHLKEKEIY